MIERAGKGEACGTARSGSVIWKTSVNLTKLEENLKSLRFVWFAPTCPALDDVLLVWLCCSGAAAGCHKSGCCNVSTNHGADRALHFKSTAKWALSACPGSARWYFAVYCCLFKIYVLQFRCVYNGDDIQLYSGLSASHLSKTKAKFSVIKATKRLIFHIKGRAEKKAILFMGKPVSGTFFMSYKDGNLTLWL